MTQTDKRCPNPTMSKTKNIYYHGNGRFTYELECGFKAEMAAGITQGPHLREPCPRCIMIAFGEKTSYLTKQ